MVFPPPGGQPVPAFLMRSVFDEKRAFPLSAFSRRIAQCFSLCTTAASRYAPGFAVLARD